MIRVAKPLSFAEEHLQAMFIAGQIGETLRDMYWPEATMIKPEQIIRLLNKAKVRFVLMGTYAINGYRDEARATQDVDVLVRERDHEKAVTAVRSKYADLEMVDYPVVTRFLDPQTKKSLIDLMRPNHDSLVAVFKNSIMVGKSHRIPDLEMALVSKFAAMVSPNRAKDKKLVDGGDFYNMVMNNFQELNESKLRRLAELVYKGGGLEIQKLIEDIKAGRSIVF